MGLNIAQGRGSRLVAACGIWAAIVGSASPCAGQISDDRPAAFGSFEPLLVDDPVVLGLGTQQRMPSGPAMPAAAYEVATTPASDHPYESGLSSGPFGAPPPTYSEDGAICDYPGFGGCGPSYVPPSRPWWKMPVGPTGRHRGLGHPLERESWLYRPFSAGWFMGMMQGGPLLDGWLGQQQGFAGGYRFGWDHNYYWGAEMRFLFASVELYDTERAKYAQYHMDDEDGIPANSPYRHRFDPRRDADIVHWDIDLLYYPWGDSQWRPYLLAGIGTAQVGFTDRLGARSHDVVFGMALAAGLKYRCNDWLALRFECADNIAFGSGSGFDTVHDVSLTGGVEVRFGGSRTAYWPYNPGRQYW